MARGWESKAVEAQIESSSEERSAKPPVTPEEAAVRQQRTALLLARSRVLQQLQKSPSPQYTAMLQQALADLDARLAKLK